MARMMSVDLSITMTAAVPRPDFKLRSVSKSIAASIIWSAGTQGTEEPPGITARRLPEPPRTPPQCLSTNSRNGIDMASSTLQGLLTCPEMQKSLVPELFLAPKLENQAVPRRKIVGATAMDSTLLTVVGEP